MRKIERTELQVANDSSQRMFFDVTRPRIFDRLATGVLACTLLLGACGKQDLLQTQKEQATAVVGAVTVLSSAARAESSVSIASLKSAQGRNFSFVDQMMDLAFGTRAQAAITSCSASVTGDTCSTTQTKTAVYNDCPINGSTSTTTFSGTVMLDYSNAGSCALVNNNDTLTRTATLTHELASGSTVTTTSSMGQDYRGTPIGGGARITRTADGYLLEILGQHLNRVSSSGMTTFNLSTRTTTPFEMSSPASTPVTLDGGKLEVIHNLAQTVTKFTADNLQFRPGSCCYPTSGALDVEFSDKETNAISTGRVTFGPACGDVEFTKDNQTIEVELASCL